MEICVALSRLSDEALVREAMRLVHADRRTAISLVRVLMEVDERQLYLHEGCGSIFVWCTKVLHIDEGPAYNRIAVARAAARFPAVLNALDSGAVSLTAVRRLAPYLTDSNQVDVLARAAGLTTRQLDLLIAEIAPRRSVPATIRRLPGTEQQSVAEPSGTLPGIGSPSSPEALPDTSTASAGQPATPCGAVSFNPRSRASAVPLSPTRFKLQMTISVETHATLRRAQDLLRHAVPNGDLVEIVDRALTVLVQHLERQRYAATDSPRASGTQSSTSRHIPATVRRAVWRACLARVPSSDAVRNRGRALRRERRAAMPSAQRLRGLAVLRPHGDVPRPCSRRRRARPRWCRQWCQRTRRRYHHPPAGRGPAGEALAETLPGSVSDSGAGTASGAGPPGQSG